MPYVIITVLVVDGTVARRTLAWWPDLAPRVPRPGRGIPWLERPWPGHGRIASTVARVTTHVIVLDGGSSSGESGIARCLQAVLPDPWPATACRWCAASSPPCGIRVGVKTASSLALAHADGHRTWIR